MRKFIWFLFFLMPYFIYCQNFDSYFINKTLRVDYIFSGDSEYQNISVSQLSQLPLWAGRRHNLSKSFLNGNGQIMMYDYRSGKCIYKSTFSTLFQEWLTTPEAKTLSRSFENVFLLPYPKEKVKIEICFRDNAGLYIQKLMHMVDPHDILIEQKGNNNITPYKIVHRGGDIDKSINVAILAEGFREEEMSQFREYASETVNQIFSYEPFSKYKDNFNFYAVESSSKDSGVSIPRENEWLSTAFGSHFDTFYSDRYLTTTRVRDIHNALAGIPYEHIIILANTNVYGGGGIYNAYTLTTTGHSGFKPVVVHEFGHSFAGLADEYFYDGDVFDETYPRQIEPWEQNITTLVDFDAKWKDMLSPRVPIPTSLSDSLKYKIGVYEGAGYSAMGIYRGSIDCRMKTNTSTDFCAVCQRAIERLILFYLKE